ncbi:MAG: tetratricopeptide repeat protein, partial [Burkholderiales bacterium]
RGDVDTIVGRALKKLPAERYQSVTAFADDLRRYLTDEPIRARPDTFRYTAVKFVRRHRAAVALAAVAAASALAGTIGTLIQARAAGEQRDFALRQLARAEAINDLNSFVLFDAAPLGKPVTASDLLARAEAIVRRQRSNPMARVDLLMSIGRQYWLQDEIEKAHTVLADAYELSRGLSDPSSRALASCNLASALAERGEHERAEALVQEGLRELPAASRYALDRAYCLHRGSEVARVSGAAVEAVARAEAARELLAQAPVQFGHLNLGALMDLAESLRAAGRQREATGVFEQAAGQMTALGRSETQLAGTLFNNWALALSQLGQPLEAEPLFRRAIEISRADGTDEAVSSTLLTNYARVL